MYRKIQCFIITLCLCMGMMPNMHVHASALQGNDPVGLDPTGYSSGKCRIANINGPIDVTVYDGEGNEIASIIDDTPQPDSRVVVSFNDSGKLVYLPVYYNYAIKLTATDDGVLDYMIQEDDPYGGLNRLVLFYGIEITKGQEYMAYLPHYREEDIKSMSGKATNTDYTLFLGTEPIPFSEELTNDDVSNAYYDVSVSTADIEKGYAYHSGMSLCYYGTYTMVEAIPFYGYEFVGWFEGDELISTEEEYRFCILRDVELVAVFQETSQEKTEQAPLSETSFLFQSDFLGRKFFQITLIRHIDFMNPNRWTQKG